MIKNTIRYQHSKTEFDDTQLLSLFDVKEKKLLQSSKNYLRKKAKKYSQEMRQRVAVRTGALRSEIGIRARGRGDLAIAYAGVTYKKSIFRIGGNRNIWLSGLMLVRGTKHMRKRDFVTPSVKALQRDSKKITADLLDLVQKNIKVSA